MELKTDIEKLRMIAAQAEQLVGNLKSYIFTQGIDDGSRGALTDTESVGFIKLIGKKLEGINISGNEDILADIITIYDTAIASIEAELAKNAELEDGHTDKFNDASIESFNQVKAALARSKDIKARPLMEVFQELIEQNENGTLDEEYRRDRINDIDADRERIEAEIREESGGLLSFGARIKPEIEDYDETLKLTEEYFAIKKEIEEIDNKLADPDLTDEDRQSYEAQKVGKEKRLVEVLKKADEKYEKDDEYKQGENESDRDYLARIQSKNPDNDVKLALGAREHDLQKKLEALKDVVIKIYNPRSKKFEDIKVKDYIDISNTDTYKLLSDKIRVDKIINSDAQKSKRQQIEELKDKRANYESENSQFNPQQLPVRTPEKMGFFSKFKKRREFFRNNKGEGKLKSFFKSFSKKEDEKVFKKEVKKCIASSDWRKSMLVSAEQLLKNGNDKQGTMANLKAQIFKNWERDD